MKLVRGESLVGKRLDRDMGFLDKPTAASGEERHPKVASERNLKGAEMTPMARRFVLTRRNGNPVKAREGLTGRLGRVPRTTPRAHDSQGRFSTKVALAGRRKVSAVIAIWPRIHGSGFIVGVKKGQYAHC